MENEKHFQSSNDSTAENPMNPGANSMEPGASLDEIIQQSEKAAKKKQIIKTVISITIIFLVAIGLIGIYYIQYSSDPVRVAEDTPLENEYIDHPSASYYISKLKSVSGDLNSIEAVSELIEDEGESYAMVIVDNTSDLFFSGVVEFEGKRGSKTVKVNYLGPHQYEPFYYPSEERPEKYRVVSGEFFKLTSFERPTDDYLLEYDFTNDLNLMHLYLEEPYVDKDAISSLAKYIYAIHIITSDSSPYTMYVYGEDVAFEADGETPVVDTARFTATLNPDENTINLYQNTVDGEQLITVIDMP